MSSYPFSHSKLEVANQCPMRYAKRYGLGGHEKRKEPDSPALRIGRFVHETIARQIFPAHRNKKSSSSNGLTGAELAEAKEILSAFDLRWPAWKERWFPSTFETEVEIGVDMKRQPTGFWEATLFRGKLDILATKPSVTIGDWKSGRLEDPDPVQLRRYAALIACESLPLISKEAREEPIRILTFWLRTGHVSGPFYVDWVAIQDIWAEIEANCARIAAMKKFPEHPSDSCRFCGFFGECVKAAEVTAAGLAPITSADEAAAAFLQRQLMERKSKDIQSALKAFVETQGPIDMGPKRLDFWPEEHVEVTDLASFCKMAADAGYPRKKLWAGMTIKASVVKNVQANPGWLDATQEFVQSGSEVKFAARRRPEKEAE